MEIKFIEMFCGIGGFRRGLERYNIELEKTNSEMAQTRNDKKGSNANLERSESWKQPHNSRGFLQRAEDQSLRGSSPSPTERQTRTKGFRCVWANDWEEADYKWVEDEETGELKWKGSRNLSGQIYRKHWNDGTYIDADIKTIDVDSIPKHTLLTAGFPCQAFSVAGKRKGFQDTRGTLFYDIARVAEAKRPKLLLLENVKGLLSHDKGLTFQIIIESLDELGYDVEWQVLNSKHFGVPQNRERVFIVGHLRGAGTQQIFPIQESSRFVAKMERKTRKGGARMENEVASAIRNGSKWSDSMIASTLDSNYWKSGRAGRSMIVADRTRTLAGKGRNLESPKPVTNALSGVQKDNLLLKGLKIRRLTPIECERLQGFPDGWTEDVSDTQRYKLLGNAVTVNVIEFLGKQLLSCVLPR